MTVLRSQFYCTFLKRRRIASMTVLTKPLEATGPVFLFRRDDLLWVEIAMRKQESVNFRRQLPSPKLQAEYLAPWRATGRIVATIPNHCQLGDIVYRPDKIAARIRRAV